MSARIITNPGDARTISVLTPPPELSIGGITPFTTIDFPGRLAAVIYTQGCPWACGYCHNGHLQPMRAPDRAIGFDKALSFLEQRRGFLDGVVFSGGEPTLQPRLPEAMAVVRSLGFQVGLHSAGVHPAALYAALPHCDWLGLDIKAPFEQYEKVTKVPDSGRRAQVSLELALDSGVELECRTTFDPRWLTERDLLTVARRLAAKGVTRFAIQRYRARDAAESTVRLRPSLVRALRGLFPGFIVR